MTRGILKKRDFKQRRNQSLSSNQESIYVQEGGPFSKRIQLKERNITKRRTKKMGEIQVM